MFFALLLGIDIHIWVKISCPGNKQLPCHFLSVVMVTCSQNEPKKNYPVNKYIKEINGIVTHLLHPVHCRWWLSGRKLTLKI